MQFNSITELFFKGGSTLLILIVCSVVSWAVVLEKWVSFHGIKENVIDDLTKRIKDSLRTKDLKETVLVIKYFTADKLFFKVRCPLTKIMEHAMEHSDEPKEELYERSIVRLDRELIVLEKRLGILSTLGAVSPFIGLFGTVLGIIKSFGALSVNQDPSHLGGLMDGIAESLVSTAAGLVVAVPAVMFYNYFIKKLRYSQTYLEDSVRDLLGEIKKARS